MPTPSSRVVVTAVVDVAAALAEVHAAVPRVVAEAKNVDVGDAGRLSFRVERGEFGAELTGKRLGVHVPLRATAALCKPLGPLGCVEVARCHPEAIASAHLVPLLDASYRFPSPEVTIALTQRCTLTAFSIDVTPRLQAEANAQAERLRERLVAALPDVRGSVEPLWDFFRTTLPLGRNACVRVTPERIVQTGPHLEGGILRGGVGAMGLLSVESPCGAVPRRAPLPPPELDEAIGPSIDLRVPLVVPWEAASTAAAQSLGTVEALYGPSLVHVTDARLLPRGPHEVGLVVTLAGDTCGELAFVGTPIWRDDKNAFSLAEIRPFGGPDVDTRALTKAIESALRIPLPVDVTSLASSVRRALSALVPPSDDGLASLAADLGETHLAEVAAAHEGLLAVASATGEATLTIRPR